MGISTVEWLQVVLAGLALLTCVVVLLTTLGMRAVALETTTLDETDTKTIVNLRLLESRVSELEKVAAALERSPGFTDISSDVVDLRTALGAFRRRGVTGVVRVPDAE
jgi:hypothetical protein